MFNVESLFRDGWPALLVLAGCAVVLLFLRLVVPWLIARYQSKKPLTKDDL